MRQIKNIKSFSDPVERDPFGEMLDLDGRYTLCANNFYQRFSGIGSMMDVQKPKKLRNKLREEYKVRGIRLEDEYGFQSRHWTQALFDVCANIKSMWSNLANHIKKKLNDSQLSDDEKAYVRYVVSSIQTWYEIMNHKPVSCKAKKYWELESKVDPERLNTVHNYIRRVTRRLKPAVSHSDKIRPMHYDQEMYKIIREGKNTYLEFASATKGKRFRVKLRDSFTCYTGKKKGDILIILDPQKRVVEIHKAIQARTRKSPGEEIVGVDKGVWTLVSCSNEKEYAVGFGKNLGDTAEHLNDMTKKRNETHAQVRNLEADINHLKQVIAAATNLDDTRGVWNQVHHLEKKKDRIETCNLGKQTFDRKYHADRWRLEQIINQALREMITEGHINILVKEDLTFERTKTDKFSKRQNMKLSLWLKGYLDERMEYLMEQYGGTTVDVNPAYTSQYCFECGAHIEIRKGDHHEIAVCPEHGEINANINAAKNVRARYDDIEITIYTPYKQVKIILDLRYEERERERLEQKEAA